MFYQTLSSKTWVGLFVIAFFGGMLGGAFVINGLQAQTVMQTESGETRIVEKQTYVEESSIIETVKKVSPSVVSIVVTKDLPLYREKRLNLNDFFMRDPFSDFNTRELDRDESGEVRTQKQKVGGGSGFIVSEDGLVVTNRHVVLDAEADYTVIFNDQTEYSAEVLSLDTLNDVAVLQLLDSEGEKVKNLPVAPLGDSDDLEIGQRVVAIGNALAEFQNSVTTGIISAKGRSLRAGTVNSTENLINLLQTDTAINPGNSGGPLVNLNGQVIAINTAIANRAEGIGFAIPINDVIHVIESVKTHGRIVRPLLGVRFMMLNAQKAQELQIDVEGGALLVGNEEAGEFAVIPGGPADKAGLKLKDVILEVDDKAITLDHPLHVAVGRKSPGDMITLKIWRNGEETEVKVVLEEAK